MVLGSASEVGSKMDRRQLGPTLEPRRRNRQAESVFGLQLVTSGAWTLPEESAEISSLRIPVAVGYLTSHGHWASAMV